MTDLPIEATIGELLRPDLNTCLVCGKNIWKHTPAQEVACAEILMAEAMEDIEEE